MNKKKFLTGILAGVMAFGSFGSFNISEVDAATRAEISEIQVKKSGNFKYRNKCSLFLLQGRLKNGS